MDIVALWCKNQPVDKKIKVVSDCGECHKWGKTFPRRENNKEPNLDFMVN